MALQSLSVHAQDLLLTEFKLIVTMAPCRALNHRLGLLGLTHLPIFKGENDSLTSVLQFGTGKERGKGHPLSQVSPMHWTNMETLAPAP